RPVSHFGGQKSVLTMGSTLSNEIIVQKTGSKPAVINSSIYDDLHIMGLKESSCYHYPWHRYTIDKNRIIPAPYNDSFISSAVHEVTTKGKQESHRHNVSV
ncbi:MAG: hypothetical protein C7B47_01550, partial [Sulfobacillus thermosulfidooxidans]